MQTNGLVYKRCYVDWGGRCAYCGVGLPKVKHVDGKIRASVDHFIPLGKGGLNSRGNRVLACYPCNLAKNDTDPRETKQWPHIEQRLAELAVAPKMGQRKLKMLTAEIVAQVFPQHNADVKEENSHDAAAALPPSSEGATGVREPEQRDHLT
ncbi:HNH endonuclease signature motif containing protein [Bradyrhizobium sp. LTSPM299]|uniref:HNH endonuclease n=1 Tax=Bradyrhizobium sp. LTSPM299 TaxID=1619233 RepID=UPI0018CE57D2|nr:HNH endonuclease signature motif containing protein [Bradyrhizobium sp. LTSPM299]